MTVAALVILWFSDIIEMKRITADVAKIPEFGRFAIVRVIRHLKTLT